MKSIQSKIFMVTMAITISVALAITIIFYKSSANTIEENYIASNQQKNKYLVESMDKSMEEAYQLLVEISCNSEVKRQITDYKNKPEDKKLESMAESLRDYNKRVSAVSSIHLIMQEEQVLVTSSDYPVYKKVIEQKSIETIVKEAKDGAGPYLQHSLTAERTPLLTFVESIRENGQIIGYVCANIGERYLYYSYMSQLKDDAVEEAMLLDNNNQIIVSEEPGIIGEHKDTCFQEIPYGAKKISEEIKMDGENIYFYYKAPFSECCLYLSVNRSMVTKSLTTLKLYYIGIFVIAVTLAIILAYYLAKVLCRPIEQLTSAMEKVSKGDLDTRAAVKSKDEIGDLSAEFNQMLEHIEELITQVIEKEKLKKDAELEALQYQITPHFMYNTLNSIKYAALIKGEKELAGVIESFVELLQATISKNGAFITVTEEVYILKNYIKLQEFRSNKVINITYQIPPNTQRCLIPRLILQPLVENALLHGIDLKDDKGRIEIVAYIEEGTLYLRVSDNGRGMTREKIEKLLKGEVRKKKGYSAIGIPNIRDRLALNYHDKGGIKFISNSTGTTAIIFLPANESEDE